MVPTRGEKCGIKHMQKEKKTVSNLQQSGYKQTKKKRLKFERSHSRLHVADQDTHPRRIRQQIKMMRLSLSSWHRMVTCDDLRGHDRGING